MKRGEFLVAGALGLGSATIWPIDAHADAQADLQAQIDAAIAGTGPRRILLPSEIALYRPLFTVARNGATPCVLELVGAPTRFIAKFHPTYTGLLGYGRGLQCKLVVTDCTFDGNSAQVGGELTTQTPGNDGLISLGYPYQDVYASQRYDGHMHEFNRCELTRATGFGCQPSAGLHFHHGIIRNHVSGWDIFGAGPGRAIIEWNEFYDSAANYADFVAADATIEPIRVDFLHNVSRRHKGGGIYVFGKGSRVQHNDLQNLQTGSGIYFDSSTTSAQRGVNVESDNLLVNIGRPK